MDALAAGACQVLTGLGGVGKTQLAAALAHRWWDAGQVDLLAWVTATSRVGVATMLAEAAAKVTGIDDPDPEQGAGRLLAWLAERHGHRWLIIFDDLADPHDLTGLWPPPSPSGRVVVTTRRRDSALLTGRQIIDVDVFTPQQAVDYLNKKLVDQPQRFVEAEQLAADLGYLPLALAQAIAYILDRGTDMTCARYRQRLTGRRRRLADLAPHALPDQHRATVAATWSLSIDRADALPPPRLARPLLELAALLDPNGIPIELIMSRGVVEYCEGRTGRPVDADDLDDALHILHRFSLLGLDESTSQIRVHGLLQRAVRDATDPFHEAGLARTAADALLQAWPEVERGASHASALRANFIALQAVGDLHLWTEIGAHPALFRSATSLGKSGLVKAATTAYEGLTHRALHILGPDHPDTFTARHGYARWLGEAGDPANAMAAFEQLLVDRLQVLGPDHPDTLNTRYQLARWRGRTGDADGAAASFEDVLTDRIRVLGPDHPDTLATRQALARWRGEAGDMAGAVAALRGVLADQERIVGGHHLNTLATRHWLAYWRGQAGDAAGAVTDFERLLSDRLQCLDPDHVDTLTTRHDLANWRGMAGDPAGAVTALEHVLVDRLRTLGADHPHTLATRHWLARWRGEAGNPRLAIQNFEALLSDRLRVLGQHHPNTIATREGLADWRKRAGPNPTARSSRRRNPPKR